MKFYIMWSLHNLQLINKKSQNFEKVTIDDRKILYSKKRSKKTVNQSKFYFKIKYHVFNQENTRPIHFKIRLLPRKSWRKQSQTILPSL